MLYKKNLPPPENQSWLTLNEAVNLGMAGWHWRNWALDSLKAWRQGMYLFQQDRNGLRWSWGYTFKHFETSDKGNELLWHVFLGHFFVGVFCALQKPELILQGFQDPNTMAGHTVVRSLLNHWQTRPQRNGELIRD